MKLLYKNPDGFYAEDRELNIKKFIPTIGRGMFLEGEKLSFKAILVRIYFYLMTRGKVNIFYVTDEKGSLMHTSYVLPKCFKFPYMQKGDYVIGPCVTYPPYRGRGIYPQVLRHILRELYTSTGEVQGTIYMVVDESNLASIKGIEKAGFIRAGYIKKTKVLKRYYIDEREDEI